MNKTALLTLVTIVVTGGALSPPAHAQSPGTSLAAITARLNADEVAIASLQATVSSQAATIAALEQKTAPITVSGTPGTSSAGLFITGVNVYIQDGNPFSRTDDGTMGIAGPVEPGAQLTGLGNLIIGYNRSAGGSHNLILGDGNTVRSFAGLITGDQNTVLSPYASVSGIFNTVSGLCASVTGGQFNLASGLAASISGGTSNIASGNGASVSGGVNNQATGDHSAVSGGNQNTASGSDSSVSGGVGIIQNNTTGWSGGTYQSP